MCKILLILAIVFLVQPAYAEEIEEKKPEPSYLAMSQGEYQEWEVALKKRCYRICVESHQECIPGCDPPDPRGTVTGCHPCYSTRKVCDKWETHCDTEDTVIT